MRSMGEYLKSGEAVVLPDVPLPDNRVILTDKIPDGAVTCQAAPAAMPMP